MLTDSGVAKPSVTFLLPVSITKRSPALPFSGQMNSVKIFRIVFKGGSAVDCGELEVRIPGSGPGGFGRNRRGGAAKTSTFEDAVALDGALLEFESAAISRYRCKRSD